MRCQERQSFSSELSPRERVGDSRLVRGDGTACGVPVETASDGWTVRTVDAAVAAHFEHTGAVGRSGATILTASTARVEDPRLAPAVL